AAFDVQEQDGDLTVESRFHHFAVECHGEALLGVRVADARILVCGGLSEASAFLGEASNTLHTDMDDTRSIPLGVGAYGDRRFAFRRDVHELRETTVAVDGDRPPAHRDASVFQGSTRPHEILA